MKNVYLYLIMLVLVISSCEKNSDMTEEETNGPSSQPASLINFKWRVSVQEEESLKKWNEFSSNSLSNVSVKLMFGGETLWESNTDRFGQVIFPETLIPSEGAFFQFESPGYYPLVVQVEGESIPLWRVNMVRNTYPEIDGQAILGADSYITITGKLQDPNTAREPWLYITNANNKIIGNCLMDPESPKFYMTTLPNEELFVHYNAECGNGVVTLGPFTESTDIGALLDATIDFSFDHDLVSLNNVNECSTGEKLYGYDLFYNINGITRQAGGNSGFNLKDCPSTGYPIHLSVATQNPRKYVDVTISHTPGQQSSVPDQEACEDDDTYLNFTIGSLIGGGDVFTYANILSDGQLVLKQAENSLTNDNRLTIVMNGSTVGSHLGDLNVVVREPINTNGWTNVDGIGGYNLTTTIISNDGQFIEGTISGEVLDPEEVSLGTLVGSFRARIQ